MMDTGENNQDNNEHVNEEELSYDQFSDTDDEWKPSEIYKESQVVEPSRSSMGSVIDFENLNVGSNAESPHSWFEKRFNQFNNINLKVDELDKNTKLMRNKSTSEVAKTIKSEKSELHIESKNKGMNNNMDKRRSKSLNYFSKINFQTTKPADVQVSDAANKQKVIKPKVVLSSREMVHVKNNSRQEDAKRRLLEKNRQKEKMKLEMLKEQEKRLKDAENRRLQNSKKKTSDKQIHIVKITPRNPLQEINKTKLKKPTDDKKHVSHRIQKKQESKENVNENNDKSSLANPTVLDPNAIKKKQTIPKGPNFRTEARAAQHKGPKNQ